MTSSHPVRSPMTSRSHLGLLVFCHHPFPKIRVILSILSRTAALPESWAYPELTVALPGLWAFLESTVEFPGTLVFLGLPVALPGQSVPLLGLSVSLPELSLPLPEPSALPLARPFSFVPEPSFLLQASPSWQAFHSLRTL